MTGLSNRTISYICKNVTGEIRRISFCGESVNDDQITCLVARCNKIEHLDLRETSITYKGLVQITKNLSSTLKDLALPSQIGIDILKDPTAVNQKLNVFYEMEALEYLHIGGEAGFLWNMNDNGGFDIEAQKHIEVLEKKFPKLAINKRTLIDTPHITDPSHKFFNQSFPEFDLSFQRD